MGHAYHQFPCHGCCAWAYLSCTRSLCHLHCDNDTAVWNGQRASMNLHLSACPSTDSYLQFKYDFLTLPWPCSIRHKRAVLHTSLRIAMSPLWFHPAIMPIKIWLHCKWILDTAPLPRDPQKTFILSGPLSGHYIYINSGGQMTKPMSLANTAENNSITGHQHTVCLILDTPNQVGLVN